MAPDVPGQVGYQAALAQLPEAHALELRLTHSGASDEEICGGLDIEPESLKPFLELARRKLHAKDVGGVVRTINFASWPGSSVVVLRFGARRAARPLDGLPVVTISETSDIDGAVRDGADTAVAVRKAG